MPRRINKIERVIDCVTVTVKALWVGKVGHDGVGAGEPAYAGHVKAGIHVDEANVIAAAVFAALVPGKAAVADSALLARRRGAVAAKGVVAHHIAHRVAHRVRHGAGAAQSLC